MIDFHSLTHAPIGAYACIEFKDDNSIVDGYYISFGTYRDDTQEDAEIFDTYGVPDTKIFYYAPQGEAELIALMSDNCYNDFKILSYELNY